MIRVALRSLRHTPGFTLTALFTLALGIGLATAVFTVAEALLLRKLPVREQDRVIALWGELADRSLDNFPVRLEDWRNFTGQSRTLEALAAFDRHGAIPQLVRDGDRISQLRRSLVSGDFFAVLESRPVLGRPLRMDDDVAGAVPVVVLSYRAWRQRFAGDSGIVGRKLNLHRDGTTVTIVGVMPEGLDYPRGVDFWSALGPAGIPTELLELDLLGRLAPGATAIAAREELTAFFQRPEFTASAWSRNLHAVVHPLPELIVGDTRPAVLAFTGAALLLLVIACINVATLLLLRGLVRVREVAVRFALGAGRGRIISQLLAENGLLAIAAGIMGLGIAAGAVGVFTRIAPADLPRLNEIRLDVPALLAAIGITAVAVLIFALAPAFLASRTASVETLRSGLRPTSSRRSRRTTEGLVAGQLALALVVLCAAGLLTRSLVQLERTDTGLQPNNLFVTELALRYDRYNTTAEQLAMLDQLLPRLRAIPGVRAASPVVTAPFNQGWLGRPMAEGQTDQEAGAGPMMNMEVVGPEYFAALGTPVTAGRAFGETDREGGPGAVIVSRSAADHFWPGTDPVGRRLFMGTRDRAYTVIGVVPDTRFHDLREERGSFFLNYRQAAFFPNAPTTLVIRAIGPTDNLATAIRRVAGETDPGIAVAQVARFDDYLRGPLAQPRLNALLLVLFAGAALVIAAVGLFGTMATMVRQRTHELGIRMAVGATAWQVAQLILGRALIITAAGSILGLLGASLATRLLGGLLYQISPTDMTTLVAVTLLMIAVSIVAAMLPARSSTRIDPLVALRSD